MENSGKSQIAGITTDRQGLGSMANEALGFRLRGMNRLFEL